MRLRRPKAQTTAITQNHEHNEETSLDPTPALVDEDGQPSDYAIIQRIIELTQAEVIMWQQHAQCSEWKNAVYAGQTINLRTSRSYSAMRLEDTCESMYLTSEQAVAIAKELSKQEHRQQRELRAAAVEHLFAPMPQEQSYSA